MKIYSHRVAQLNSNQLPIFRIERGERTFVACILQDSYEAFPYDLSETCKETIRRMLELDGDTTSVGTVWCIEVDCPEDAMDQVMEAVLCAPEHGKVAFMCPDEPTAQEVSQVLLNKMLDARL